MRHSTPRTALIAAFFALVCMLGVTGAQAAKPDLGDEAGAFVRRFMAQADILLADKALEPSDRSQVFRGLLATGFDIDVISRYILDDHWYQATPEERDAFRRLFADYLFTVYEEHLGNFDGLRLEVVAARQKGNKGAQVRSKLSDSTNGASLNVEWRLWQARGGWRIVDVLVQGVSLVKAYREQFASLVGASEGNVTSILDALRDIAPAAGRVPSN